MGGHLTIEKSFSYSALKLIPRVFILICFLGGSFLFFGASNGSIYYIDMEKFPLRMIDNDLLVSELFRDPSSPSVPITALSVYLPTKTKSFHGNSIEIAYGTSTGLVRVIVQYP